MFEHDTQPTDINDTHCPNAAFFAGPGFPSQRSWFLLFFCVRWIKELGDCLFCEYWWNYWPSLFKLSLHNLACELNVIDLLLTFTHVAIGD